MTARKRDGMKAVRFECTGLGGSGEHKKKVLGTVRVWPEGRLEYVSSVLTTAPFNRRSEGQRTRSRAPGGLPSAPFELLCPGCGRNPRPSQDTMRKVIDGLHLAYPGHAVVSVDISSPLAATLL